MWRLTAEVNRNDFFQSSTYFVLFRKNKNRKINFKKNENKNLISSESNSFKITFNIIHEKRKIYLTKNLAKNKKIGIKDKKFYSLL